MPHRSRSTNRTVFCARGINISVLKIAHENEVKSASSERRKENTQMQNKQEKNYRVFLLLLLLFYDVGMPRKGERDRMNERK